MLALSIACVLAAVAWGYLVAGHGGYWRTSQWLPPVSRDPRTWPDVVAVVPARNEAEMLPATLPALLGQDYPGTLTVIVVDDRSSDGTAEVAAKLGGGRPLRVIAGTPPPAGWAGKVWAMNTGLAAAGLRPAAGGCAEPDGYVLFTDADITLSARTLRDLVAAAKADDRDLVSQMALLRTATGWERVVVPAFVYFFAQLYPFRRVNVPGSRTAAAAGGCMLVRRGALEKSGGLAPIGGALIDDVAMGRMVKRQRGRCWLGLSRQVVSVRPYPGLASLWQMVARSAYIQLNYSPVLLAATITGLLFLYLLPPAGAVAGLAILLSGGAASFDAGLAALVAGAGLAGWALMSLSYLPMLRLYRLSPLRAPGLPLIALLYAAMTADSARRHHTGRGAEWRGRTEAGPLGLPRDRHKPNWSVVGGRPGSRLASLRHRRRLHRCPTRRQPARGVPGRARPGRGRDAAHGPGAEPVRDSVLRARRGLRGRPAADLHPRRRTVLRRPSGARLGVRARRGPGHVGGDARDRDRPDTRGTAAGPRPDRLRPDGAAHPGSRTVRGRRGAAGRAGRPGIRPARRGVPQRAPARLRRAGQRGRGRRAVAGPARARPASDLCEHLRRRGLAWKTRIFAPYHGVPEDPATGSAAGPLAVHLARHGRIGFGEEIEIRQGEEIGRPSRLYAQAKGSADKVESVLVGGSAVIVARGEYRLG